MPPLQLALRYYGLRAQGDIIDDRFQSNIQALHAQTDDCIFFARKLADDLLNYGTRLRRRNAWKYRLGIPKMVREDWKFVDKGLMPDESLYANWLRGFVKQPSRIERLRKRFLAAAKLSLKWGIDLSETAESRYARRPVMTETAPLRW
jgi:hypothetical protein